MSPRLGGALATHSEPAHQGSHSLKETPQLSEGLQELKRSLASPGEEAEALTTAWREVLPGLVSEAGRLLQHPESSVRVAALRYLARVQVEHGGWDNAVMRLFADPDPEVREWAARASGQIRNFAAACIADPLLEGEAWAELQPEMQHELLWLRVASACGAQSPLMGGRCYPRALVDAHKPPPHNEGRPVSPSVLEVVLGGVLLQWGEQRITPCPGPEFRLELAGGTVLSTEGFMAGSGNPEAGRLRLLFPLDTGPQPPSVEWNIHSGGPGVLKLEATLRCPEGIAVEGWSVGFPLSIDFTAWRLNGGQWTDQRAVGQWRIAGEEQAPILWQAMTEDGSLPELQVRREGVGSLETRVIPRLVVGRQVFILEFHSIAPVDAFRGSTSVWRGTLSLLRRHPGVLPAACRGDHQ